ncbi:hypothetical protein MsAc7_01930 [Methanolapillus millepedarum]|uniref:Uncharacterized protein n=1 Tax=Methanolapillus millepedarum TaxID=3028296 RepID=A0AA96V1F1_9EURY|nr:hypothetical protein MsAc7_01930 [Methanosarcinaceae archaeon Ac7]
MNHRLEICAKLRHDFIKKRLEDLKMETNGLKKSEKKRKKRKEKTKRMKKIKLTKKEKSDENQFFNALSITISAIRSSAPIGFL